MTQTLLKFTKAHGPYVAGDIAGFSEAMAGKMKAVAAPYTPPAAASDGLGVEVLTVALDTETASKEVEEMVAAAKAEVDAYEAQVEARLVEDRQKLDARAAELAQRETKIVQAETSDADSTMDPPEQGKKSGPKDK